MATTFSFRSAMFGAVSLIAIGATPAFAQEDADSADGNAERSSGGINTIIVTAQRREESVQDVPIAITAFNQAELQARGISTALEVAAFVPNLIGLNNTGLGTANAYYLRGVGSTESIATFDPPIGTYVDDIYLSRQNANNLSLFDVDRVEVLRGPQGTLFGRNTTGGAVNVFLAEPGDDVSGYAEIGFGSYNEKLFRASVDVPLADSFAVKVSGYWHDDDGYVQNSVTGERYNQNDGWGVRLGLRGELSDNARWTGSYIYTFADAANIVNSECDPNNPTDCSGRFSATGLTAGGDFNSAAFGPLFTGDKVNFGEGNEATMDFISSNLELGLGDDWSVNIITGFVDINQQFALDFADGRAPPNASDTNPGVVGYTFGGFTISNQGEHTQFTQEIKLNGTIGDGLIDLVGGVFYFYEDNKTDFGDIFSIPLAPVPDGFPLLLADRVLKNTGEAWAGYVQADINVTDQVKLTAGIRYTDETKTFDISDNRAAIGGGLCFGPAQFGPSPCLNNDNLIASNGVIIPDEQSVKIWTPRFAVNYEVNDDVLLFASATRGFKSGGWNARGTSPNELLPFAPETAWSYEAGVKSELFNNLVRLNVTAFWLDLKDLQSPSAFLRTDGSIGFITRNFADYRNKGLEIEFQTAPADGLNIFASLGYQDDKYVLSSSTPEFDEFGVQSALFQQADCLAQLGAGLLPNGATGGTDPRTADTALSCGSGIIKADGSIAEPVRTPDFTVAIGGSYEAQFGSFSLTPAINANWRTKNETGTSNVSFYDGDTIGAVTGTPYPANSLGIGNFVSPTIGSFSKSRWIVNASLTLRADAGWSLVAECKNCFDETSVESSLAEYSYFNRPRSWNVRAKYEF